MKRLLLLLWVCALLRLPTAGAELTLGLPFTDLMVLQRGVPAPIWGTAEPGRGITVEFAGQSKATTTDATGSWRVTLDPLEASFADRPLTVQGGSTVTLQRVQVGEVWFCSGQSNMEIGLTRLKTAGYGSPAERAEAIARLEQELATTTPGIRVFRTGPAKTDTKKDRWLECGPEALADPPGRQGFSALAYFFGKELQPALGVPIGLMVAAAGGSRIERWTPPEAYAALPAFAAEVAAAPLTIDGVAPGSFFRAFVQPLAPFAVRGVLWYQGESNLIEGDEGLRYTEKMEALITSWRAHWRQPALPFYYVQLPGLLYSKRRGPLKLGPLSLPQFRDAQARALRLPHTGMVVTADLATGNDIHPGNKWEIAHRLARLALARNYGRRDLVDSGPQVSGVEVRGDTLAVIFAPAAAGLKSSDGEPLRDFAVAGEDRQFMPAAAVIEGNRVVVRSPEVARPIAVRFAWHESARPNLANRAGLPAAPFRSDHWEIPAVAPHAQR